MSSWGGHGCWQLLASLPGPPGVACGCHFRTARDAPNRGEAPRAPGRTARACRSAPARAEKMGVRRRRRHRATFRSSCRRTLNLAPRTTPSCPTMPWTRFLTLLCRRRAATLARAHRHAAARAAARPRVAPRRRRLLSGTSAARSRSSSLGRAIAGKRRGHGRRFTPDGPRGARRSTPRAAPTCAGSKRPAFRRGLEICCVSARRASCSPTPRNSPPRVSTHKNASDRRGTRL